MSEKRKAAPPPKIEPKKRRAVRTAGKQEDFAEQAKELAAALGWDGEPSWIVAPEVPREPEETVEEYEKRAAVLTLQDGITVRDARRYCQKVLHEHFVAGALGRERPDSSAACRHLAVDTPEEQQAIEKALAAAYETGKGKPTSEHRARTVSIDAELQGTAGSAMAALSRAESKAGKGN